MSFRAWILAVLLLPAPAAAVTPYLVKDIDPSGLGLGSQPTGFASLGDRAIFFTEERELWSSDGSSAGTIRLTGETFSPGALAVGESVAYVKADDPSGFHQLWETDGSAEGTRPLVTDPLYFDGNARRNTCIVLPGTDRFFFTAEDASHGLELWSSDATPEGTQVIDLAAGPVGSAPHELTLFEGRVYFVADDGRGFSLWSTDGTSGGTHRAEDFGTAGRQTGGAWFLTVVGSRLDFFVLEPDGWTLWTRDGRGNGAVRVKRFAPATAGIQAVTALSDAISRNGRLFFVALDGTGSRQLWVSDGTSAGTRRLTGFSGAAASTAEGSFIPQPAEGGLLFVATDRAHGREPWTSDGTVGGTHRLLDICRGACSGWVESDRAAGFRGRVLFPAWTVKRGIELWSTDGTATGTRLLFDACQGTCSGYPYPIASTSGKLYFGALGGLRIQIWRTNGTASGTVRLSDFAELLAPGERYEGAGAGGFFLFSGLDAVIGRELWRTDGSRPGTQFLADLVTDQPGSSSPQALHRAGSRVVFLADAGDGTGLWASDGTESGTRELVAANGPTSPFILSGASTGDHVTYFYAIENGVYDLWRTNGTAEGTFPITPPGFRIETSQAVQVFGDVGYFTAEDSDLGEELWLTDGTREGTRLVADVDPGPPGSQPDRFTSFVGHLVFEARVGGDLFLYASDGTEAGTKPLVEAFPFLEGARLLDVETEGIALFQKNDASSHAEIWATDGTEAGTHLVLGGLTFLSDFSASGGRFLFRAGASFESQAVYLSDGTSAGTHPIATDRALRSDLVRLQAVGARFVFSAARLDDPSHPALWITDGTSEGMHPLIETASASDQPRTATAFGIRLLLAGGSRAWSTDGTPEGTAIELETGSAAQTPLPVVAGERAYYPWTTPETGTELWALRPE